MLGFGIYYYEAKNYDGTIYGLNVAVGMIVTGAVALATTLLGCAAALTTNRPVLIIYSVLLVILTTGLIVVFVIAFARLPNVDDLIGTAWDNSDANARLSIQKEYNCIGKQMCVQMIHGSVYDGLLAIGIICASASAMSLIAFISALILIVDGRKYV